MIARASQKFSVSYEQEPRLVVSWFWGGATGIRFEFLSENGRLCGDATNPDTRYPFGHWFEERGIPLEAHELILVPTEQYSRRTNKPSFWSTWQKNSFLDGMQLLTDLLGEPVRFFEATEDTPGMRIAVQYEVGVRVPRIDYDQKRPINILTDNDALRGFVQTVHYRPTGQDAPPAGRIPILRNTYSEPHVGEASLKHCLDCGSLNPFCYAPHRMFTRFCRQSDESGIYWITQ